MTGEHMGESNRARGEHWPPPPDAVPRTRAEIVAAHGPGAERTWRRVRHGMYVPPGAEVTAQVRALAELRARPTAVLSGAAAARAWGHPCVAADVPEIVLIGRDDGGRAAACVSEPVTIRRRRLAGRARRCELAIGAGGTATILVAGPLDATIDCVANLPEDEAIAFLDGAIRVWRIDDALRRWAGESGRDGAARMRELLQWVDWRAESRPESLLRTKLRRAGQGQWVPQLMVLVGSGKRWIDLGDHDLRIGLEYHGQGHWKDAEARRSDALRVNEFREVGWLIIEVTALDLFRDFDSLLRRIDEHRRRIEAERAADLAWRRGKAIDGMRLRLNRWLK
ncbi:hypothetical protein [Corynebacterium xerosis]|uniref:hypothetical protein n=1 Tax=Corynebacterium xerosis TaxID=1725 RepID=UPI000A9288F5|nr:hypothetical protein [Corynebacterium xerosis]SQB95986.1 Uncharacterised protein [Clostridium paraputrificum]